MSSTPSQIPDPNPHHLSLLEDVLERAAETLGDITPHVLEHYYARYPEAPSLFKERSHGRTEKLEREMVDSALYCMMTLFERPHEIQFLFEDTVPQHDLLKIPPRFLVGLQQSVIAVVRRVVAEDEKDMHTIFDELEETLNNMILSASETPYTQTRAN